MAREMSNDAAQRSFSAALDGLVDQVRHDKSVLAAILCGSLSHDAVWSKSDIDLVLVTIDDRKVDETGISLYADGVNVHAILMPRAEFRRTAEGAVRNSFAHSFLAKGRLLYSHDETIEQMFGALTVMGARDREMALFRAATGVLPPLYKAHKFMRTRGDVNYTAWWILNTAVPLARIEVIAAGLLADRDVIPQATKINPDLFAKVYTDLLNTKKTEKNVHAALDAIDDYLGARARNLFAPVIEHLREAGEARSCTEIETHFEKTFDVGGVTTACEYLADQNILGKASISRRLTKRSNVDVQELAFFAID